MRKLRAGSWPAGAGWVGTVAGDVLPEILDALRDVYDPCCREKGISVVDMGLVRSATSDDAGRTRVELLLTSGWCPFAVRVLDEVTERVAAIPGVTDADVEIVWNEAWTTDRLSPDAHRKLRFLPHPNELSMISQEDIR